MIENENQGIHYKMKFSLDTKSDGFVRYNLNHPQVFVLGVVMLIKKE